MPLSISAGVATDTGRVRTVNEDAWCLLPRMYAVADGMGGHAAGDRASQIAIEALSDLESRPGFTAEDVQAALAAANDTMVAESSTIVAGRAMGTTVAGIAVTGAGDGDQLLAFNIGDSRVYRVVDGSLEQVSVDHSEVQEMIDSGRLDPADAADYPRRNVVTRSLGSPHAEAADTWSFPLVAGQVFLICSDGLTGELSDEQIQAVLASTAVPSEASRQLVLEAVEAGGHDNVTVVVLRVLDDEDEDTVPRLDVGEIRSGTREAQ